MKKILIALTLAFLTVFVPLAEAKSVTRCEGKSLLERERLKDPKGYAQAMAEAAKVPYGNAVFWRIEKPGSDKVSWLFGTIHVTDDRVNKLSAPAKKAITNAKAIALELTDIADKKAQTRAVLRNLALITLPAGENLYTLLGSKDAAKLKKLLKKRHIPAGNLAGMKPIIVAPMISLPECESIRKKLGIPVLDIALLNFGTKNNIPLVPLETMREQLQAFASMTIADQKIYLMKAVERADEGANDLETMIQLYLHRKTNLMFGLLKLQDKQAKNGIGKHFTRILIKNRNKIMLKRSLPLLEKGGAFIAVGALHLVGKDGLVSLYKQNGYRLVPVD